MLKEILLAQKAERDKLLAKDYIPRSQLPAAAKSLAGPLIKVVTGPRRSGKSVFCLMLLKGKNFAYVNFDDENLLKTDNYDEIVEALFAVYPQVRYCLFDEIQNLDRWEFFVNKLQRRGLNLVLTGSNAKLLSRELASALTGRYLPWEILPFSFSEYLAAKNFAFTKKSAVLPEVGGRIFSHLSDYLVAGGFPETATTGVDAKLYLGTLFDSILLRDIVRRRRLRLTAGLTDLAGYLINNFSAPVSFSRLKTALNFNSVVTVQNFCSYLEEAYLVFFLPRFAYKFREQVKSPQKTYVIDNGLIAAKSVSFSPNRGRLMENLVFLELIRRGFHPGRELFYYRSATGREVDFIIKKGTAAAMAVQACFRPERPEIYRRETAGLLAAQKDLGVKNLLVITWDEAKEVKLKGARIVFRPLWQWLLGL